MNYDRYKTLLIEKADGIATVTMNAPEILNSFTNESHWEMEQIWNDVAEDPDINVAILTGAGRAFSAGGNIKKMVERYGKPEQIQRIGGPITEAAKRLVAGFINCPKPIVGAINGDAMGLGATIALMCDIVVM